MPNIPETIEPMEARSVKTLPAGADWQYEPKWDGYRCLVFRDGATIELRSKKQTLLNRYFPEVVKGFQKLTARQFTLDGEIVLLQDGRPNFEALQLRLHPAASRVARLSVETPASFIAFDLLSLGAMDLRAAPLSERRSRLEKLFEKSKRAGFLQLSPATKSIRDANKWLKMIGNGIDGIMAKRLDLPYTPGQRSMEKFKLWRTVDCVIAGLYLDEHSDVEYYLLGLYDAEGLLHYVGRVRPPGTKAKAAAKVKASLGGDGFTGRSPLGKSRWSRKERKAVMLKPKIVIEVSADHITGGHMRHGSRFLRWRPDKKPKSCTMDQIG